MILSGGGGAMVLSMPEVQPEVQHWILTDETYDSPASIAAGHLLHPGLIYSLPAFEHVL